jgi:FkbM family methyltransferase
MKIYYGIESNRVDITEKALELCKFDSVLYIPSAHWDRLFGDPIFGTHKCIYIEDNNSFIFNDTQDILYNMELKKVYKLSIPNIQEKLSDIHSKLTLNYGSFKEEYPEQEIAVRFLKGNEKVLEIGGNIGRNSLVIASILHDSKQLVSLECDPVSVKKLQENRDTNSFKFHIEPSALSKRKLLQRGWDTIASETLLDGYKEVATITYDELLDKYKIPFDTLIADCEGALYYIFSDMPEMLNSINMIIMENDYRDITHKEHVDSVLLSYKFTRVYCEAGGWEPCYSRFYEVWKK